MAAAVLCDYYSNQTAVYLERDAVNLPGSLRKSIGHNTSVRRWRHHAGRSLEAICNRVTRYASYFLWTCECYFKFAIKLDEWSTLLGLLLASYTYLMALRIWWSGYRVEQCPCINKVDLTSSSIAKSCREGPGTPMRWGVGRCDVFLKWRAFCGKRFICFIWDCTFTGWCMGFLYELPTTWTLCYMDFLWSLFTVPQFFDYWLLVCTNTVSHKREHVLWYTEAPSLRKPGTQGSIPKW